MASEITDESYNGLASLYAGVGKWVPAEIDCFNLYSFSSGSSNAVTLLGNAMTLDVGDWDLDYGFAVGHTLTITFTDYSLPNPQNPVTTVKTIDYINGDIMYLDSGFGSYPSATFPTAGALSGINIQADEDPESLEFFFNLTKNGQQSVNSVIDQQVNKFIADTGTLAESATIPMIQQNLFSGGWMKNVQVTRNTNNGIRRQYTISFDLFQWGIIQDGFETPSYYANIDNLTPYILTKMVSINGNPNSVQTATNGASQASTGFFGENFNGGVANYLRDSFAIVDLLGDPIGKIDYSNFCDFTGVLTAPNQDTLLSTYRIGMAWLPQDTDFYQGQALNLGENLLINAPDQDFLHSLVPDATVYQGEQNAEGVQFDFSELQFEQFGVDKLRVTGRITPNAAAIDFFDEIPDDGRRMVIWVLVGNHLLTGQNSDEVPVLLYNDDNFDAPTLGVQIPNVVTSVLYDHGGNDISPTITPNTTTEDDVLLIGNIQLLDNVAYEGIRTSITIFNDVTLETFELESNFFPFDNVVEIAGQFQPNFTINRGFNLPPTTDRNIISVKRNTLNDVAGKYGVEINYGYLSRWQYWLEQANAADFFFDILESFDGKNKDWQRFTPGDWSLRVSYFTRVDGVDDFQHQLVKIRPYEDDANTSLVRTFTNLADLTNPTSLVANTLMQIDVEFTSSAIEFSNHWVEFTIEDFESGNRWVISSILAQGNVSANPFKPVVGSTMIDVVVLPVNVLTATCVIDTSIINVNNVSLSYRVYSDDVVFSENILTVAKDAEIGISVRKIADDAVYPDSSPCMRVRRSSDNVELDIGFSGSPLALDVGTPTTVNSLLWHVTKNNTEPANDGFVVKWHDQSNNNNHGVQTSGSQQPKIVSGGSVTVDPNNGLPAVLFDGANDFMNLTANIATSQLFYESWVMNRASAGILSIALSAVGVQPHAAQWKANNNIVTGMGTVRIHAAGDVNTGDFLITTRRIAAANDIYAYRNGVALANFINTVDVLRNFTNFGSTGGYHDGHMQELIYYKKDKSADQTDIETNTNNYYSIF